MGGSGSGKTPYCGLIGGHLNLLQVKIRVVGQVGASAKIP